MLLDLTFFCHCLGIFGIEGKWHRLVDELMNAMKLLYCEEFMDCQVIPIRSKVLWWDIRKGLARDSGVHFQPKVGYPTSEVLNHKHTIQNLTEPHSTPSPSTPYYIFL